MSVYAYADCAYFTWPRYQASQSSSCFDSMIQLTWSPSDWMFTARYRLKMRQRDNAGKTALVYKTDHRGRLSAAYSGAAWQLRTQVDAVLSSFNGSSFGWMLTQSAGRHIIKGVRLNLSAGYFDTDGYGSRVYTYERGLRYSSFSTSFYGRGVRCVLNAVAEPCEPFSLIAKIGATKYFDRSQIGSGYSLIDGSSATDLELQVRLKL